MVVAAKPCSSQICHHLCPHDSLWPPLSLWTTKKCQDHEPRKPRTCTAAPAEVTANQQVSERPVRALSVPGIFVFCFWCGEGGRVLFFFVFLPLVRGAFPFCCCRVCVSVWLIRAVGAGRGDFFAVGAGGVLFLFGPEPPLHQQENTTLQSLRALCTVSDIHVHLFEQRVLNLNTRLYNRMGMLPKSASVMRVLVH